MELFRRVIRIADILGLGLWHIKVEERPEEAGDPDVGDGSQYAVIDIRGQHEAVITFYREFFEAEAFEQLRVIVHELLHCHFAELDDVIESLPTIVERLLTSVQKLDVSDEDAVNAVADMFCASLEENFIARAHKLLDAVARMVVLVNDMGLDRDGS